MNTKKIKYLSYEQVKESLPMRRKEIYSAISSFKNGATASEISSFTGKPINCVVGRINELMTAKLLSCDSYKLNLSTNRINSVYHINKEVKKLDFNSSNMLPKKDRLVKAFTEIDAYAGNSVKKTEIVRDILCILNNWSLL